MSMNVAPAEGGDGEEIPMSDINMTSLIDVMLVLLIIFLITIPVLVENIEVELPDVRLQATTTKPENVSLSIRGGGDGCEVYWNLTRVDSQELYDRAVGRLEDLIEEAGGVENMTEDDLPEVHIRGDVDTPWRCIGGPIYMMQRAGFARVGFISEPPPGVGIQRL